jgi:hypothetical protein
MAQQNLAEGLKLEQVIGLREKTDKIAKLLMTQLRDYLDTIRSLMAPERVFGRYVRAPLRDDVAGADAAFKKLCAKFNESCGRPFSLPPDLPEKALAELDARLELYPWEYTHEAKSDSESKTVTVTSPVRCVLAYKTAYSLAQLRLAVAGKTDRKQDDVREFIVAALAMGFVFEKFPGIARLLRDLRYDVQIEKCPGLGDLSLVVIAACIQSFRPADELVLATTRLSGVPAFIELIDVEAIQQLSDPLKPRLLELLK